MPHVLDPMIAELEYSFPVTRRVLERIPSDRLDWRPNPKGMSLGQLAMHTATIPLSVARMGANEVLDITGVDFTTDPPESLKAIMQAFDDSAAGAADVLRDYSDDLLATPFRFVKGDVEVFALPRQDMVRQILLNHLYHHRGQLTTYLRALDCDVPAVFGTSADENPFAAAMA